MDNLKQADRGGREMRDIRIVHLPESDVDAAHAVGNEPEDRAGRMIAEFAHKKTVGKASRTATVRLQPSETCG